MLQAIGLTSTSRRYLTPAVDDLTFEARPGGVTALLGARGSGKSTALRLMLELEDGRGVTYFRGRPLHAIANPAQEVGVLLGDVPGHPARTARSQLRMLCAAAGVPVSRADDMLDLVGIAALRDARLGSLSLGMDRRLGLAAALLGDPHTLLLDAPSRGLSPREHSWLFGLLRAHAAHGGTVLYTTADPKEAARTADRVVTIDGGRLVADQDVADFARTRLRPRVAVRTPHAVRLAAALRSESRAARRSVEVVTEDGNRLSVYGSSCAEIGDAAFRHGVLVHQLADEIGDAGPRPVPAPEQRAEAPSGVALAAPEAGAAPAPDLPAGRRLAERDGSVRRAFPHGGPAHAAAHHSGPRPAAPYAPGRHPEPLHRAAPLPQAALHSTPGSAAAAMPSGTPAHGAGRDPDALRTDALRTDALRPEVPGSAALGSVVSGPTASRSDTPSHGASRSAASGSDASRPDALRLEAKPPSAWGRDASGSRSPAGMSRPADARADRADSLRGGRAELLERGRDATAEESPFRLRRGAPGTRRAPSQPLQPLRYELRRFLGVRTTYLVAAAVLVCSAALSALLAYAGRTPLPGLLAAWPEALPLPPAAFGAGVLGALSFGEESRYPALATARGTVPRRLGLLLAKLTVTGTAALLIGCAVAVLDAQVLWLLYGSDPVPSVGNWRALSLSWAGLLIGCAWTGLLAAGTFRPTAAGVAAVLAVPMAVAPLVRQAFAGPSGRSVEGFPGRLRELVWLQWPHEVDRWLLAAVRALVQPVGTALTLSISVLLCAYLLISLRGKARW
ncbi:ATP-binding cassette domain-containing protein [Streptomyces wuyuanensis]|uniref:ABC-type multidrug transport system, ATPase component n=1 Tax=Streptomyces wuyuanensis TaxID=1196353 RepID=A0A1G9MH84_9ACTN|nr:ATP-binding cassette domain-containing protein [Streptomyces wuyuanensis]SDL73351.1 ABC-type multidrug transport system, ATPase component [Streptomyces wuyuanensis]